MAWSDESVMVDIDTVSRYLGVLTGGKFAPGVARGFPVPKEKTQWSLWSRDGRALAKMPYVNVAWMEDDGTLHIDTEPLGNTSDTTEWMYGDKALFEFVNMDLTGFENEKVRAEYAKKFPKVVRRLETYQRLVAKESSKRGVQMDLVFHGGKGLASFHLSARFGTNKLSTPLVLHEIDRSVAALKKVYYEMVERQKNLYFIYALPENRKGTPEETN